MVPSIRSLKGEPVFTRHCLGSPLNPFCPPCSCSTSLVVSRHRFGHFQFSECPTNAPQRSRICSGMSPALLRPACSSSSCSKACAGSRSLKAPKTLHSALSPASKQRVWRQVLTRSYLAVKDPPGIFETLRTLSPKGSTTSPLCPSGSPTLAAHDGEKRQRSLAMVSLKRVWLSPLGPGRE